jgi:hypothetical protein
VQIPIEKEVSLMNNKSNNSPGGSSFNMSNQKKRFELKIDEADEEE